MRAQKLPKLPSHAVAQRAPAGFVRVFSDELGGLWLQDGETVRPTGAVGDWVALALASDITGEAAARQVAEGFQLHLFLEITRPTDGIVGMLLCQLPAEFISLWPWGAGALGLPSTTVGATPNIAAIRGGDGMAEVMALFSPPIARFAFDGVLPLVRA